jgi:hypothetical protein
MILGLWGKIYFFLGLRAALLPLRYSRALRKNAPLGAAPAVADWLAIARTFLFCPRER